MKNRLGTSDGHMVRPLSDAAKAAIKAQKTCPDCKRERKEYGVQSCTKHYNLEADNHRSMRQSGMGIHGY